MTASFSIKNSLGAVVIGRNEGSRLRLCLESLISATDRVIYVDSGSTDNSVMIAAELGVSVVPLDMSKPFTAARARNSGFKALIAKYPQLDYVQFIDGDCELSPSWLEKAAAFLQENQAYAITCGRLHERFPESSIYNTLCDVEWNTPVGESTSCGGIALIRATALDQAEGFREDLIAGEEPEMCFRLREKGWKIYRLDADMAKHDAAILHFSQWWQRTKRGGFAYVEGSHLHGKSPEKYWVKETRSILVWGGLLPALIFLTALFITPWFFLVGILYPLQFFKISLAKYKAVKSWKLAFAYGFFIVLGKFPQFLGVLRFYKAKWCSHQSGLIEYK